MAFVKSSNTSTPTGRSQAELERILRRYGASGFGVQSDYAAHIIRVIFRVPDVPGHPTTVPVRLEVNIETVARALGYGKPRASWDKTWKKLSESQWEQAERVAWRHLIVWVDAALSAATAGLQPISEAFLAHTLVDGPNGKSIRVVDLMNLNAPEGNWRGLLSAGSGG